MGSTGSENTGQASGRRRPARPLRARGAGDSPLSGNEIRQLLTMTAEDVLPSNTGTIGQPDKADVGWDPHFGYGRVNLAGAMARIANDPIGPPAAGLPCRPERRSDCIPPEAQIDAPDWFAPINVDRAARRRACAVSGRAAAPHSTRASAPGSSSTPAARTRSTPTFQAVRRSSAIAAPGAVDGVLGDDPEGAARRPRRHGNCDGAVANDAGRPAGRRRGAGRPIRIPSPTPSATPSRSASPSTRHDDPANFGRYRKTLFPYADDGNLDGWPQPLGAGSDAGELVTGSGGEASPRLYDLDGDNELDVLQADLERRALRARLRRHPGRELQRRRSR